MPENLRLRYAPSVSENPRGSRYALVSALLSQPEAMGLDVMKIASGKVVGGKVVVAGTSLADGAAVTVLVAENEESFELDSDEEIALLLALDDGDRNDFVGAEQMLKALRRQWT